METCHFDWHKCTVNLNCWQTSLCPSSESVVKLSHKSFPPQQPMKNTSPGTLLWASNLLHTLTHLQTHTHTHTNTHTHTHTHTERERQIQYTHTDKHKYRPRHIHTQYKSMDKHAGRCNLVTRPMCKFMSLITSVTVFSQLQPPMTHCRGLQLGLGESGCK